MHAQWAPVVARWGAVLLLGLGVLAAAAGRETAAPVLRIELAGPIGPASSDYFRRAVARAHALEAQAVLVRMDTPGGLDSAMREIIQVILTAPVPVITYVSPGGARAASAGTYILYASHVAAMAPGTNLGAATPVQIGGLPGLPERKPAPGEEEKKEGKKDAPATVPPEADAMTRKAVNDAAAYIRSLAELRGRNAEWAEQAVREAVSLSAAQAQRRGVIDLVADSEAALLEALDGRAYTLPAGAVTLHTAAAPVQEWLPDWRTRLLATITNPSIAYLLILVGIYGLIFEFLHPGGILPGVVGSICLLLALYGLQMLPVNYAGLALILLGVALMVGEAFAPSFGVLGIGGAAALVIGSLILMDTRAPGFGVPLPLILAVAATSLGLAFFVLGALLRSRRQAVVSGAEALLSASGEVLETLPGGAWVRVQGERWRARSAAALAPGQRVRVCGRDGLILAVEPDSREGRS